MELSFYGWLWMIVGAVFIPMEVIAYVASVIKVVLDRYRIKRTNTTRRQFKLTGLPSGKRLNIFIIKDEERAFKLMSNGSCQGNNSKRVSDPSSSSLEASSEKGQHKQNGGHSVKVTVEYNLEVRSLSGDVAVLHRSQLLKDNTFKKITAAKRSITIDGDNLVSYASFCGGNSKIGIVSSSGTLLAGADAISGKIVSSSSTSLPDLYRNKQNKQPPPKPKRNQSTVNKTAAIIEAENSVCTIQVPAIETENKFTQDNSSIDGCHDVPSSIGDDKKASLSANNAQVNRRHSSTSATDTDCEVIHVSPNLSRSEDHLFSSSREVHLTNNSTHGHVDTGHFSGHDNVAFTDSSKEMRTNL